MICAKCQKPRTDDRLKRDKLRKHGHPDWCSGCYAKHAFKIRNGRVSKTTRRKWNLSIRYGLTPDQVDAMIQEQDGNCAICVDPLPERFHIDHNHKTGKVRGLLCSSCNLRLTIVEDADRLARAIAYLAKHNEEVIRNG